jgi:hypothetical protein
MYEKEGKSRFSSSLLFSKLIEYARLCGAAAVVG